MIIIKLVSIILGLTVISKTYYDYKKHLEGLPTFLFWSIAWLGIMYATIQPEEIYSLIQRFSQQNIGLGTFGGVAFVFLFYVTYRVYIKANRLERQIQDLVMKIGIKNIER